MAPLTIYRRPHRHMGFHFTHSSTSMKQIFQKRKERVRRIVGFSFPAPIYNCLADPEAQDTFENLTKVPATGRAVEGNVIHKCS